MGVGLRVEFPERARSEPSKGVAPRPGATSGIGASRTRDGSTSCDKMRSRRRCPETLRESDRWLCGRECTPAELATARRAGRNPFFSVCSRLAFSSAFPPDQQPNESGALADFGPDAVSPLRREPFVCFTSPRHSRGRARHSDAKKARGRSTCAFPCPAISADPGTSAEIAPSPSSGQAAARAANPSQTPSPRGLGPRPLLLARRPTRHFFVPCNSIHKVGGALCADWCSLRFRLEGWRRRRAEEPL